MTLLTVHGGKGRAVTVERIERAIETVARMIVMHDIDLMPTIRKLEAERDSLKEATAAMDYAREILRLKGATWEATSKKAA